MNTAYDVDVLRHKLVDAETSKPDIVCQIAEACMGWPYVFGAWGELCTPANRKRRVSSEHPSIKQKCPALNGKSCEDCKWGEGVRMYDCRGFTRWLLQQAGLDITGQGATQQYNTSSNWISKGQISDMPNVVCCVFKQKDGKMEHTGMHVGNGKIIHCSVNVQTGKTSDRGWTHYAIPVGLYNEGEIPVVKQTLRRGSTGDMVRELQTKLNELGYTCGAADGIFGAKTESAVKKFQSDNGLVSDGVCGPKTWEKLDSAEAVPTYTVTIEGLTWKQFMQIRETYPMAEAAKE